MQLPIIEIERLEAGMGGKASDPETNPTKKHTKFKWKQKDLEFNTWEVAHFRLLGDDRRLP
jgi:hypothetical protein